MTVVENVEGLCELKSMFGEGPAPSSQYIDRNLRCLADASHNSQISLPDSPDRYFSKSTFAGLNVSGSYPPFLKMFVAQQQHTVRMVPFLPRS